MLLQCDQISLGLEDRNNAHQARRTGDLTLTPASPAASSPSPLTATSIASTTLVSAMRLTTAPTLAVATLLVLVLLFLGQVNDFFGYP